MMDMRKIRMLKGRKMHGGEKKEKRSNGTRFDVALDGENYFLMGVKGKKWDFGPKFWNIFTFWCKTAGTFRMKGKRWCPVTWSATSKRTRPWCPWRSTRRGCWPRSSSQPIQVPLRYPFFLNAEQLINKKRTKFVARRNPIKILLLISIISYNNSLFEQIATSNLFIKFYRTGGHLHDDKL